MLLSDVAQMGVGASCLAESSLIEEMWRTEGAHQMLVTWSPNPSQASQAAGWDKEAIHCEMLQWVGMCSAGYSVMLLSLMVQLWVQHAAQHAKPHTMRFCSALARASPVLWQYFNMS